jgi:tRNA pseudouridine38-40 synthase
VGEGRRDIDWPARLQDRGERASEILVMPAHGLSLEEVLYPADEELAARADQARARREAPEHGPEQTP